MSTIGWLFILVSVFVMRAVAKGRVKDIPQDISDGFLAIVTGKPDDFAEVLKRTGDSTTATAPEFNADSYGASVAEAVGDVAASAAAAAGKGSLAAAAIARGKAAKGYRWGYSGQDGYYDCSGLMWKACQDIGYTGGRFTTSDVAKRKGFVTIPARSVGPNDIVLWKNSHMGVFLHDDIYYSARSRKSGIGESSISSHGGTPTYLRYTG